MNDYKIIPLPTLRSSLDHPSVADLTRHLIHELQQHRVVLSERERMQLAHLRSVVNVLLQDDVVQID